MLTTAAQQRPAAARPDRSRGNGAPVVLRRTSTVLTSAQACTLWLEYRRTRDRRLRDRLIVNHIPLVKRVARSNTSHLPVGCDVEDFISCGLIELITAIDRFDPASGAVPESFLWTRIQGAIRDHRRNLDWLPRSVRNTQSQMQAARLQFTATHGRLPSPMQLAEMLGRTPALVHKHEERMAKAEIASLNEVVVDERPVDPDDPCEPVERIDVLHSVDVNSDPSRVATVAAAKYRFRAAFTALTERQREIARMLYCEELTLREAGVVVGVCDSRISQIHKEIRDSLRLALCADAPLLSEVA